MLTDLHIENIAIIDKLDVELKQGFIVLTGESGAGKSIIIDSLGMLLGNRVSRDMVRTGTNKGLVSAVFTDIGTNAKSKLTAYGYESDDDYLIVSRELNSDGRSVARINGRPVNVTILKEICSDLVNIHGQHDNEALLDRDSHIRFLDRYANNGKELALYEKAYSEALEIKRKITALSTDGYEKEKRLEFLKYQISEIENANIKDGEEESLEQRRNLLINCEKILESVNNLQNIISGNEINIHDMLLTCVRESKIVSKYDTSQCIVNEKLTDIAEEISDIAEELREYSENLDFDSNELNNVEERLDLIHRLKAKYGKTVSEINNYLVESKNELNSLDSSDELLKELTEKFGKLKFEMKEKARILTESRVEAAIRLESEMIETLEFLEMPKVSFSVSIKPKKYDKTGSDSVTFLLSSNVGEELKPLNKIASGGELSRIILGLKNILADNSVQTMIFDEVDTGISGKAAQKVAIKLKEMSKTSQGQVIVITHLAQIAAYADIHFKIVKKTVKDRTYTELNCLSHDERRHELARIMGGINITESLLKTAEEMLRISQTE